MASLVVGLTILGAIGIKKAHEKHQNEIPHTSNLSITCACEDCTLYPGMTRRERKQMRKEAKRARKAGLPAPEMPPPTYATPGAAAPAYTPRSACASTEDLPLPAYQARHPAGPMMDVKN